MSSQSYGKTIVFLDTVPFLFLFSKRIEILEKTIAEILSEDDFTFFVPDSCWTKVHYEKWRQIDEISSDFRDVDYVNTLYRSMNYKISDRLLNLISSIYWRRKERFTEKVKEIRLLLRGASKPNIEELETILLASLIESSDPTYDCRTEAILGDDKHTRILADLFECGVTVKTSDFYKYPLTKTLTLIDFFSELRGKETIPEKIMVDTILSNYSKFKVESVDKRRMIEFPQKLPIFTPTKIPSGTDIPTFIVHFASARDEFVASLLEISEKMLEELISLFLRAILFDNQRMLAYQRLLFCRFRRTYKKLVEGFYQKYKSSFKPSDLKHSISLFDTISEVIRNTCKNACKNITLNERFIVN